MMPLIWRTNDILTLIVLLLLIALLVAVLLRRVRFVRTHYPMASGGYADDYCLAWGKADKTLAATLQRAARKVAVGR